MSDRISTRRVSELTGCPVPTLLYYAREVLPPAVQTEKREGHRWNRVQTLAIGLGQVLRAMGFRGEPIHRVIQAIGRYSEHDLDIALESTPIILALPGRDVCPFLAPRDAVDRYAMDSLERLGVLPVGVDVDRMWRRLNEQLDSAEVTSE